jgi:hypothetical protein
MEVGYVPIGLGYSPGGVFNYQGVPASSLGIVTGGS